MVPSSIQHFVAEESAWVNWVSLHGQNAQTYRHNVIVVVVTVFARCFNNIDTCLNQSNSTLSYC